MPEPQPPAAEAHDDRADERENAPGIQQQTPVRMIGAADHEAVSQRHPWAERGDEVGRCAEREDQADADHDAADTGILTPPHQCHDERQQRPDAEEREHAEEPGGERRAQSSQVGEATIHSHR